MRSRLQPMTLRRFVQVTFDNFRQLIQTIATPTTTLPMAVPAPIPVNKPPAPPALVVAPPDAVPPVGTPATEAGAPGARREAGAASSPSSTHRRSPAPVATPIPDATDAGSLSEPVGDPHVPSIAVTSSLPLDAALESLLFVAEEPVEPRQLARVFGLDDAAVAAGLQELSEHYRAAGRGLRLQERNGRYQLVTVPAAAALIETFLNLDVSSKLSGPALETLAVVAYRQPVTRAQIEAVRGVDCSGVLRSLLQRGIIEEVGRLDAPGRPVIYGVTDLFMRHFGLTGLNELPPLETGELDRIDEVLTPSPSV